MPLETMSTISGDWRGDFTRSNLAEDPWEVLMNQDQRLDLADKASSSKQYEEDPGRDSDPGHKPGWDFGYNKNYQKRKMNIRKSELVSLVAL